MRMVLRIADNPGVNEFSGISRSPGKDGSFWVFMKYCTFWLNLDVEWAYKDVENVPVLH